jgi:glycosyltransferase involved in cell wall biosynthesis
MSYNKGAETFYDLARSFPLQKFLGVKGGYGEQYVPDDLPPNVTIMEHTNNPIDYLSRTKILLCPSRYESYGRSAIEASASGIPSLSTRTPGTLEGVGRYQTTIEGFSLFEWERELGLLLDEATYMQASVDALFGCAALWGRTKDEWLDVVNLLESL